MAKVVKKKKRKLGGRSTGGGTSGKKVTPLRPYRNPRTPPCQPGCPIGNDARGALAFVGTAETCSRDMDAAFEEAFRIFARTNPFPAITGRLCTACCEKECNRQHKDGSVYINKFERFLGDYAIEKKLAFSKLDGAKGDGKIAVVGAGPSGLTCAYHLALRGWQVTVFDSADRPGGFLRYLAPFRLPRKVLDAEIQRIRDLGVELKTGTVVGKDVTVEQLNKDYQAVYVAVGAHGERKVAARWQADNSMTGLEFMARVNAGEAVELGDQVVVLGGGNPALDVARTAKRLGAATTVIFRRTKEDMSAIPHEVEQAVAEGIDFEFLAEPKEIVRNGERAVKLVCQRLAVGHADGSGRHRLKPVKGEVFERPVSTLIMGQIQEPDYGDPLLRVGLGPGQAHWGDNLLTQTPGLFGGGDANRLGHVTVAIAQGRIAAEQIHAQLSGPADGEAAKEEPRELIDHKKVKLEWYKDANRSEQDVVPVGDRFGSDGLTLEATLGFSRDSAVAEAKRCFSCGMCMDCDNCWMYCQDQAVEKLAKDLPVGEHYKYKHELCTGCEKCAEECPCGYLKMV